MSVRFGSPTCAVSGELRSVVVVGVSDAFLSSVRGSSVDAGEHRQIKHMYKTNNQSKNNNKA